MAEFRVGEDVYRTDGAIPLFKANDILSRLLPAVQNAVPAIAALVKAQATEDTLLDVLAKASEGATPLARAMASMSDEDRHYVIMGMMTVVQKKQGKTWQNMVAMDGQQLMFQNISLMQMYTILFHVFQENYWGFFQDLSQTMRATVSAPQEPATSP
jgi:hypothetical protein